MGIETAKEISIESNNLGIKEIIPMLFHFKTGTVLKLKLNLCLIYSMNYLKINRNFFHLIVLFLTQ